MNLGHRERIAEVEELRRVNAALLARLSEASDGEIDLRDLPVDIDIRPPAEATTSQPS